ncbi:helix-turn-helix transcriptional regulator [Diaphorobacter caeni]|uniref:helix-turn-helix transcriptional regulator n=1 Tax=Diaphorobacter caeni TaxID=2784387 RepID=UPI00188F79F1|nr:helix-turn-helix transcriptional regulator [Diaphorobacter caeni]MBF5006436.1 helix-turn-helix transcriptional regulator [Diaphorobacter caeni]
MGPSRITHSASDEDDGSARWRLPSGTPMLRRSLCSLAQPCLMKAQRTPRFLFHDATVLLVAAGRIDLDDTVQQLTVDTPSSLLLVEANTSAHLVKTPGGVEQRFRSIFLTLPSTLLETFHRTRTPTQMDKERTPSFRQVLLDDDLTSTLQHVLASVDAQRVSDERLQYRLMDLLAALAERGSLFQQSPLNSASRRLRTLISEAPEQQWTAREAGRALAMSEATLRRRLSDERTRFEDLLIDVRMHHALMLLQTTSFHISDISQACGYKSRARFAERFHARFGYLPSAVR